MAEFDVIVSFEDDEATSAAVRRLVRDLRDVDEVGTATLKTCEGEEGAKGLVEDLGGVAITLLNAGGAALVVDILRMLLPRSGPKSSSRKIEVVTKEGERVLLEGAMTDEEFLASRDRLFALLDG